MITEMMVKMFCNIGVHDWQYSSERYDACRECRRCHKTQMASYDMATGETVYLTEVKK